MGACSWAWCRRTAAPPTCTVGGGLADAAETVLRQSAFWGARLPNSNSRTLALLSSPPRGRHWQDRKLKHGSRRQQPSTGLPFSPNDSRAAQSRGSKRAWRAVSLRALGRPGAPRPQRPVQLQCFSQRDSFPLRPRENVRACFACLSAFGLWELAPKALPRLVPFLKPRGG